LYRTLNNYHAYQNEAKADLHLLDLANLFFANKPKDKEFYEGVFDTLQSYQPNMETVRELVRSIQRSKILRDLSLSTYEAAEGKSELSKVLQLVQKLQETTEEQISEESVNEEFVNCKLSQIVAATVSKPGLRWRLSALNRALGSLRRGDFGFIFARPETGKTTFLASEISFMLDQTTGIVLWFNNEEQGEKVMLRIYQAYFGLTLEELLANVPKYEELFLQKTEGRLKLFDSANINKQKVEVLCKKYSPALVLFDQIDKIQGFQADREDLHLGAIYIWAREIAKKYCPVIGVCQADGTGEGVRYLTMSHVANAKTAKQAEADWILGIGTIHDTGWESVRFLNISKNKLMGDEDTESKLRHGKLEVLIEPQIARYKDMQQ
jgi:replicative DNA helicase